MNDPESLDQLFDVDSVRSRKCDVSERSESFERLFTPNDRNQVAGNKELFLVLLSFLCLFYYCFEYLNLSSFKHIMQVQ